MNDRHIGQDQPQCPHCDYVMRDAWEVDFGLGIEGDAVVSCGSCGEDYEVYRHATIYYDSHKVGP